ncbi:SGNH/GDSL hydrolase family protein [Robbsia sp. KACC 23696]|uniref:SGNH/GDSL hydrolase family protein n=1 Tax=Robbsia sp. KACC 23696 TaxID=3149231 RepID=UPI00325BB718
MPLASNIVVFGDSLSDIGQKWKTPTGRLGIMLKEMFVSPNGRYSDGGNWTDHMIEAASPVTLLKKTAEATFKRSARHHGMRGSRSTIRGARPFQYANYAMGAAVGDGQHFNKLASQMAFTSFKDQVDLFEQDIRKITGDLGNTLFIIWFGANDLYTDGRPSNTMDSTVKAVIEQRNRLSRLMTSRNSPCQFVNVGLLGPMTIVRYIRQLKEAVNAAVEASNISLSEVLATSTWFTSQLENAKKIQRALPVPRTARAFITLDKVIEDIDRCVIGADLYNAKLRLATETSGDAFADIAFHFNEAVIKHFVEFYPGALAVGAQDSVAAHFSRDGYIKASKGMVPIATIDELHPTDPVYAQMWEVIFQAIRGTNWTFGDLDHRYANNMLGDVARAMPRPVGMMPPPI